MSLATMMMKNISSWSDFHKKSREVFGFPEFYGGNNNAWIDCMSYLHEDNGMSSFVLAENETMDVLLADFGAFSEEHPEMALGIVQLFSHVNARYAEREDRLMLRLLVT